MRPLGVPKGVVVVGHLVELEVGGVGKDGGEEGGGGGGDGDGHGGVVEGGGGEVVHHRPQGEDGGEAEGGQTDR